MQYRYLGRSGLKVSVLTFGSLLFEGKHSIDALDASDMNDARRQLDMGLEAGINLFDTQDVYAASQEALGALINGRRNRMLVGSKVRFPIGSGPNDEGLSRKHIIESCELSLKRLGIDHIDLFYLHGWDGRTPVEETLGALDDLVRAGKIRYVGVSNFSGWHLMKMLGAGAINGLVRPVAQQIYYTLLAREAEYELVPIAIDQGVGVLVWSPLASGRLLGQDPHWGTAWPPHELNHEGVVAALRAISEQRGVSMAQIALAWLLGRPAVASLVIGARTEAQLAENLAAVDIILSQEERSILDSASAPPLIYPYWHQIKNSARLSEADESLFSGRGDVAPAIK